jgi:hypothetical protein
MSMLVTTLVPEGIVMAADSCLATFKMIDMINFSSGTCAHEKDNIVGSKLVTKTAHKLHVMKVNKIAISDGNQRNYGNLSIAPYIDYFCQNNNYDNPKNCAEDLLNFMAKISPNIKSIYHVCGYDFSGKIPQPEFWYVDIANNVVINGVGNKQYGINISGANEYFFSMCL